MIWYFSQWNRHCSTSTIIWLHGWLEVRPKLHETFVRMNECQNYLARSSTFELIFLQGHICTYPGQPGICPKSRLKCSCACVATYKRWSMFFKKRKRLKVSTLTFLSLYISPWTSLYQTLVNDSRRHVPDPNWFGPAVSCQIAVERAGRYVLFWSFWQLNLPRCWLCEKDVLARGLLYIVSREKKTWTVEGVQI